MLLRWPLYLCKQAKTLRKLNKWNKKAVINHLSHNIGSPGIAEYTNGTWTVTMGNQCDCTNNWMTKFVLIHTWQYQNCISKTAVKDNGNSWLIHNIVGYTSPCSSWVLHLVQLLSYWQGPVVTQHPIPMESSATLIKMTSYRSCTDVRGTVVSCTSVYWMCRGSSADNGSQSNDQKCFTDTIKRSRPDFRLSRFWSQSRTIPQEGTGYDEGEIAPCMMREKKLSEVV